MEIKPAGIPLFPASTLPVAGRCVALVIVLLITCCHLGCALIKANRTWVDFFDLQKTTKMVFVKFDGSDNYGVAYSPTCFAISNSNLINRMILGLSLSKKQGGYLMNGELASLVLLDHRDKPIALVSAEAYDCVILIAKCEKRYGKFVIPDKYITERGMKEDPFWPAVNARGFVKELYGFMQEQMKEELSALKNAHALHGEDLEEVLFHATEWEIKKEKRHSGLSAVTNGVIAPSGQK